MPVTINGDGTITGYSPAVADGSVTSAKLANGAVGTNQLANGAVGTNQLANGAVTLAKTTNVSGIIPIASTTITSNTSSITLDHFTTDYRQYMVVVDKVSCTVNNRDFQFFLRDSGGNMTSGYKSTMTGDGSDMTTSGSFARVNYNSVGYNVNGGITQQDFHAVIYFSGFETNRRVRFHGHSSYQSSDNSVRGQSFAGCCERNETVIGVNFHWQSGDFVAGGKISLFGVNM